MEQMELYLDKDKGTFSLGYKDIVSLQKILEYPKLLGGSKNKTKLIEILTKAFPIVNAIFKVNLRKSDFEPLDLITGVLHYEKYWKKDLKDNTGTLRVNTSAFLNRDEVRIKKTLNKWQKELQDVDVAGTIVETYILLKSFQDILYEQKVYNFYSDKFSKKFLLNSSYTIKTAKQKTKISLFEDELWPVNIFYVNYPVLGLIKIDVRDYWDKMSMLISRFEVDEESKFDLINNLHYLLKNPYFVGNTLDNFDKKIIDTGERIYVLRSEWIPSQDDKVLKRDLSYRKVSVSNNQKVEEIYSTDKSGKESIIMQRNINFERDSNYLDSPFRINIANLINFYKVATTTDEEKQILNYPKDNYNKMIDYNEMIRYLEDFLSSEDSLRIIDWILIEKSIDDSTHYKYSKSILESEALPVTEYMINYINDFVNYVKIPKEYQKEIIKYSFSFEDYESSIRYMMGYFYDELVYGFRKMNPNFSYWSVDSYKRDMDNHLQNSKSEVLLRVNKMLEESNLDTELNYNKIDSEKFKVILLDIKERLQNLYKELLELGDKAVAEEYIIAITNTVKDIQKYVDGVEVKQMYRNIAIMYHYIYWSKYSYLKSVIDAKDKKDGKIKTLWS